MGGRPKSACPGVHAMAVKSTYRNSKSTEEGVFTSKVVIVRRKGFVMPEGGTAGKLF